MTAAERELAEERAAKGDAHSAKLRDLVAAVWKARVAADRRCSHADPDECCDRCRVATTLSQPVLDATRAAMRLSEAITPNVLAVVEVIETLGSARAKFGTSIGDDAMFDASRAENHAAMRAVCDLADLLHAAKGAG